MSLIRDALVGMIRVWVLALRTLELKITFIDTSHDTMMNTSKGSARVARSIGSTGARTWIINVDVPATGAHSLLVCVSSWGWAQENKGARSKEREASDS